MKKFICFAFAVLLMGAALHVSAADTSPGLFNKFTVEKASLPAVLAEAPVVICNVAEPALVLHASPAVITRVVTREVVRISPEKIIKVPYSPGWLNVTRYTVLHVKFKTDKVVHNWIIPYSRDRSQS